MTLPSKKLILLPFLWITALTLTISILVAETNGGRLPSWINHKREETKQDAGIKLLNMLMPPENFSRILLGSNASSLAEIPPEDLVKYYEQLTKVMPWMPEGYAVAGLCHYRRGLKQEAFEEFQKACALDPHFFWACQNLAVMSLEVGQMSLAEQIFEMSLSQDPRYTLNVLASSKVYHDLLILDPSYNAAAALQDAYVRDAKMLERMKNKTPVKAADVDLQIRML
jgi:tetratricopeptide (TPR) repeat protein